MLKAYQTNFNLNLITLKYMFILFSPSCFFHKAS